ncbi:protein containing PEP-CTERM bacterial domain, partial [sediment metagenome]
AAGGAFDGETIGLSGAPTAPNFYDDPGFANTVFVLSGWFAPPVSVTSYMEIYGALAGSTPNTYTVTFPVPVTDVRVHLSSLASTATFGSPISKLSGQGTFVVAGTQVAGQFLDGSTPNDANGSVALPGTLTSFSFTLESLGDYRDGVGFAVAAARAASAVPEPLSAALVLVGLGAMVASRRTVQPSSTKPRLE